MEKDENGSNRENERNPVVNGVQIPKRKCGIGGRGRGERKARERERESACDRGKGFSTTGRSGRFENVKSRRWGSSGRRDKGTTISFSFFGNSFCHLVICI